MDRQLIASREQITSELKTAVRNINRNLYEWMEIKCKKMNFTTTQTEVYSLVRNWMIRCLRSAVDRNSVDRIFKRGHLFITMASDGSIGKLGLGFHERSYFNYDMTKMVGEILEGLNYQELIYNPNDYKSDGSTQRDDEFYYPKYEPLSITETKYESLKPKN